MLSLGHFRYFCTCYLQKQTPTSMFLETSENGECEETLASEMINQTSLSLWRRQTWRRCTSSVCSHYLALPQGLKPLEGRCLALAVVPKPRVPLYICLRWRPTATSRSSGWPFLKHHCIFRVTVSRDWRQVLSRGDVGSRGGRCSWALWAF